MGRHAPPGAPIADAGRGWGLQGVARLGRGGGGAACVARALHSPIPPLLTHPPTHPPTGPPTYPPMQERQERETFLHQQEGILKVGQRTLTLAHARTHAWTHARTHACTHARMDARTHARMHAPSPHARAP